MPETADGTAAWEGDRLVRLLEISTAANAVAPTHFCLFENKIPPPFLAYEVS